MFVLPALRKLMGHTPYSRPTTSARLTHDLRSPDGRRQFARAQYAVDASGPIVTPVGGHGSHLIGDLAQSDALVVVPEGVGSVAAGEQVQVLRLDEEF
jgi:molybdopterin molybdotransferase